MRPCGGFTPDMINFANSTNVYKIWADMIAYGSSLQEVGEHFYCAFAGRRDGKNFDLGHAELMEKYGGLFRETDSSLTDYGAYLTYREIMNVVAKRYPDAAPRTEEEFDWKATEVLGGNLVGYREIDKNVIKEEVIAATPKFSLDLGTNAPGQSKISSLRKYFDYENGDYTVFTTADSADNINGIAERWLIEDTSRTDLDLPSALIYRDYSALVLSDILAERFEKCMLNKAGELALNLTIAGQYASEGDKVVDYIIVIVSEENLDNAFKLALA